MKHNLIKTDNYLLVIDDDSDIKDVRPYIGRWHLEKGLILNKFPTYLTDLSECKLVLSHAPLNGAPYLDGVDLLPPLEDDELDKIYDEVDYAYNDWKLFEKGYNKAKEKYKYTEEDLRKACIMYAQWITGGTPSLRIAQNPGERFEQIIQSLQHHPKYPIAFECEMEVGDYGDKDGLRKFVKTITNSQGETECVGKYIYE